MRYKKKNLEKQNKKKHTSRLFYIVDKKQGTLVIQNVYETDY